MRAIARRPSCFARVSPHRLGAPLSNFIPRDISLRSEAAVIRSLADELELLSPHGGTGVRAQIVDELTSLGHRLLETAATLSRESDEALESAGDADERRVSRAAPWRKPARSMLRWNGMSAHVRNLMTTDVVCISADASLTEAAHTLAARGFSALTVLNADGAPIGIVSETDLMRLLLTNATTAATVREFMSTPVEIVDELDTADAVIHRMRAHRIHHMPVVRNGKLVGMVTPGDVVRWFVKHRLDSLRALA